MMAPECTIYGRNYRFDDFSVPMNRQGSTEENPVQIGSNTWSGGRVIVLPRIKIENHAIVGARVA